MARPVKTKAATAPPTQSGPPAASSRLTSSSEFRLVVTIVLGWLAMLLFAGHASTHMVAAGDTWVAMACGRHFVNQAKAKKTLLPFHVDTVEPFSANSHKAGPTPEEVETWPGWAQRLTKLVGLETVKKWHPTGWVNQNWLTHVIFYKLTTTLGSEDKPFFNALVLWKFAVYLLAMLCLYATGRILGAGRAVAALATCCALFIGRSFFDIRPAGFSNLLVAVYMLILVLTCRRSHLYIWLLVPLVVFWCNVHGGYIYAFIVLVPFVGWQVLMLIPDRCRVAPYSIGAWLVMFGLARRFLDHDLLQHLQVPMAKDWAFYLVLLFVMGSLVLMVLTAARAVAKSWLVAYSIAVSVLLFLLLLTRFFPSVPPNLNEYFRQELKEYIAGAQWSFVGLVAFMMLLKYLLASSAPRLLTGIGARGIAHTIGAGAAAFVAMVILNPFHLTNLTHTFIISVSEHAERWRNVHEWHRAFDWGNPVGTAYPFLLMYAAGWLVLLVWVLIAVPVFREPSRTIAKRARSTMTVDYPWPKVNVGLWLVAALTIYMAIRSRRFIPLAAFAACPIIALLGDRLVRIVAAVKIRRLLCPLLVLIEALLIYSAAWCSASGKIEPPWDSRCATLAIILAVPIFGLMIVSLVSTILDAKKRDRAPEFQSTRMPSHLWHTAFATATGVVLILAVAWVVKFSRVYLGFWPADPKHTSIFMRMTASDAKPFNACRFIRDNKLSGKMFNYWTEGGFIAYGQVPDPNTGRIPLLLFMDGRAQAAYDREAFDEWAGISSGGPAWRAAILRGRSLTVADYVEIGKWIDDELRKRDVWVVLMPAGQFKDQFVMGLEHNGNWQAVFLNNRQRMFVDITSSQGKELFSGILTGQTRFPDDFSRGLTLAHTLLIMQGSENKKKGLDIAQKTFNLYPSPAPMIEIVVLGSREPQLRASVERFCLDYLQKFEANKSTYSNQDAYNMKVEAARLAASHLQQLAAIRRETQAEQSYAMRALNYRQKWLDVTRSKKW